MAIDSATPRTRRAIILAGLGGVAATVAGALSRPAKAFAAEPGDPFLLGTLNQIESSTTRLAATALGTSDLLQLDVAGDGGAALSISNENNRAILATSMNSSAIGAGSVDAPAIWASNNSLGQATFKANNAMNGTAVLGWIGSEPPAEANTGVVGISNTDATARGVVGKSDAGSGVEGLSTTGRGLLGKSTSGIGIRGESSQGTGIRAIGAKGRALLASTTSTSLPAIASQTTGTKSAIQGFAGAGAIPAPSPETGVQGRADKSENSVGVLGESSLGTGVVGASDTGYGVFGVGYYGVYAFGQVGVVGDVDSGTGIQGWTGQALAPNPPPNVGVWAGGESGRTALEVSGVAKFSRSGKTTFSAGQASKKITVPGGITAGSFAFADLQQDRPGVLVRAVVPNTADSSITIILNATVSSTTAVGWMVVG